MQFKGDMCLTQIVEEAKKFDLKINIEFLCSGSEDDPDAKYSWRIRVPGGLYEGEVVKCRGEDGGEGFSLTARPHTFISWS